MSIILSTLIEEVTLDEVKFFDELSKKFPLVEYVNHLNEMTKPEMEKLLGLLGPERNLTLRPSSWAYGCTYEVAHISRNSIPRYETLFGAKEGMWPEIGNPPSNHQRFNFLSQWFMRDSNIQLIASTGEDVPVNDYSNYDY